jgi:hypothetical protein
MLRFIKEDSKKSKQPTYKIFVKRGFGLSLGNMIEVLGSVDTSIPDGVAHDWIKVRRRHNRWTVVDDSMTDKKGDWIRDNTALGFPVWDDEVKDLDNFSDAASCFGMSEKLQWEDVTLTPDYFQASSIERLCEALDHVCFCAWCPGDV